MNKLHLFLLIGLISLLSLQATAFAQTANNASEDKSQSNTALFDREFLFSLSVPLWYTFKPADDGKRFQQRDSTFGLIGALQLNEMGGVGLEYYEIPIQNPDNKTVIEKDSIVHTIIDLIYVIPMPIPLNLAVGAGYGQSEVQGDNASRFKTGECYQWFIRGGLVLTQKLHIHMGYHDVYSKIPFKDNDDYGIEAGGYMYSAGISVTF